MDGNTSLTYAEPEWLASRHGVREELRELIQAMTAELAGKVRQVTKGTQTIAE